MKKLINFRPILYFAVSLSMGILFAYSFALNKIVLGVIAVSLFVSFTLLLWLFWRGADCKNILDKEKPSIKSKVKAKIIYSSIALALAIVGGINTYLTINSFAGADLGGRKFNVTGKITQIAPTENGDTCLVSNVTLKGTFSGKTKYKILLYVTGKSDLDVGDKISFTTTLIDRATVYENKFSSHNVAEKIKYSATVDANDVNSISRHRTPLESVNVFIRDTLEKGLDEKEFTVAYALMCGNSDYMDSDVISNFRASGVAHIFAVSGLHIGFFAVVLNFIAGKLRFNKYFKFFFIISVLITYSGVCGFTSSSIRATVMTAVMLFAELLGKKYDGVSSISTAFIGILCFAPLQLFCVGFQLSFGVVLGIALLSRPISKLLKFLPKKLSESLGVVLSAQIFGIPISLASFGEFSLVAIIANLLFIPLVGVIYVTLLIATFIGGIFGVQTVALFIPNYVFKVIIILITAFDYRIFMVGGFSFFGFSVLFYLAFLLWSDKINLKILARTLASCLCAVTFISCVIAYNVNERRAVKLVAVGTGNISASVISASEKTVLIINEMDGSSSLSRLFRAIDGVDDNIDAVVVANAYGGMDVQVIISRLTRKYGVFNVYYYGEDNAIVQTGLEKNFKSTEFYPILDGKVIDFGKFTISFSLNGYCSVVKTKKTTAYLFSEFGTGSPNYLGLDKNPALVLAVDYADQIFSEYQPNKKLCYRNGVYPNTLSQGNVSLKI